MSPNDCIEWIFSWFRKDDTIERRLNQMQADLTNLQNAVTANTVATQAVIAEIQKLIAAPTVDPVALQSIVDTLNTNTTSLTNAIPK